MDFSIQDTVEWRMKRRSFQAIIQKFEWVTKRDFTIMMENLDRLAAKVENAHVYHRRHPNTSNTANLNLAIQEWDEAIQMFRDNVVLSKLFNE